MIVSDARNERPPRCHRAGEDRPANARDQPLGRFEPLGITDVEWVRYRNGDPVAASGLRLRPRDLAKIGQLVLAHGVWGDKRVVSASWIEQSMSPQINAEGFMFYGYQWRLGRSLVARREIKWWVMADNACSSCQTLTWRWS